MCDFICSVTSVLPNVFIFSIMLLIIQHAAQEAASSYFADVLWDGFEYAKICIELVFKSMSALQH